MRKFLALALAATTAACAVEQDRDNGPVEPRVFSERARSGASFFKAEAGAEGALVVTLPKPDSEGVVLRAIHSAGLTAGLGSNPVGLDRGYADEGRIIAFRRIGDRLVIEQENWTYRATSENSAERKSVEQSFARSFLWSGAIEEEKPNGTFTINLASFLTGDILDLEGVLTRTGQGSYSIDPARSMIDRTSILTFPDNVEVDAFVTLVGDKPGDQVAATAANGRSFTLTVHHSFVRLPDDGFEPRLFDPRAGAIDVPFYDFSAALDAPLVTRYARRFRLERKDPAARSGPVKKPIVFYVDRGAPELVRRALIEGAAWWADAFKAAGYEDAYRVEILPEGAHPLDVRYNVIQWVHRQTRGWSYGGGVYDPRTGEMLKANVVLGSQRVRQDRMIFEGLAGVRNNGSGAADDPVRLSLARIRQLSAHEVGHTLGFAHNFAASSNDRASVMDYPAPYVRPKADGGLDFSGAYATGVGEWDKVSAIWLYGEFGEGEDEAKALDQVVRGAYGRGLRFVDDGAARGVESAHPYAAVWDNGADAIASLAETMRVREIALARFGQDAIADRRPTSDLSAVMVPLYLYHRYQVDAAAKLIGGFEFRYAVKGDSDAAGRVVAADRQRAALSALLKTLDPAVLDLPDAVLGLLTPEIGSFSGVAFGGEKFPGDTAPIFDLLSAADAAATKTLSAILHPARSARLIEMERRSPNAMTYDEVLAAIEETVFWTPADGRRAEIARRIAMRHVSMLIEIAAGAAAGGDAQASSAYLNFGPGAIASPEVASRTETYLKSLAARLGASPVSAFGVERGHREFLHDIITAHLERPAPALHPTAKSADIPPGSPIGESCWFCD